MKAAIYCRLSEEDRNKENKADDSNSIKNQKAMLLQYAAAQKWEIYDIYSDDDYAGADRNRPQFKRLLSDAEARKFDIVLCKTQSRFTRELELVEKYIHGLFPVWGIRFISIVDHADTDNKGNKKARQINGLVNEWYLEDMSDNIRSVLTSRRENGYHIGAFAPYGYQKDPQLRGHLVIDAEAAGVVREIFKMFAMGYGKSAIARSLNDRGIPNPTEYKRRHGIRYEGPHKSAETIWKYPAISHILTNEVYIGNLIQGKYGSISYKTKECRPRPREQWIRVENTHEPIIDQELWEQVQHKVASHAKPFGTTGRIHPFSGKVVCAYCGYAVRIHKAHGRYYLQCNTRQASKGMCPGAFIPMLELESILLTELKKLNNALIDQNELEKGLALAAGSEMQKGRILNDKIGYERKIEEQEKTLRQLYMDKVRGIVTETDYSELYECFYREKAKLEGLASQCHDELCGIDGKNRAEDKRVELVKQYMDCASFTKDMSDSLIDHIEIGHRDKKTGLVPVCIFWKF
ncbi:MAG: recombinase family protein [Eubacteriales bacterium]|nr:recombinase family protein [Eubacteriales bacterium]